MPDDKARHRLVDYLERNWVPITIVTTVTVVSGLVTIWYAFTRDTIPEFLAKNGVTSMTLVRVLALCVGTTMAVLQVMLVAQVVRWRVAARALAELPSRQPTVITDGPTPQLLPSSLASTDIRVELHGRGSASVVVWNTTGRAIKVEGMGQIRPETEVHYERSTPFALDWEGQRHKHQIEIAPSRYATAIIAKPYVDRVVKLWLYGDDSIVDQWSPDSPTTILLKVTIRDAATGSILWERPCELKFWPSGRTFKFRSQDA